MLDTTKENTNGILLNNEDDVVKPSLLSFSCVRMKKERTKILLRSALKPKYRSAEKVKVSLALIIEEAAVQRDCKPECTVAKTEAFSWKQGDMKARRAAHRNQWQI